MKIAKDNDINRPTVSNPDLGVMTWYKELNDIDIGMLGSPIMAKLKLGPTLTEYYLHYGLPDIIEAHGYWIRRYCDSNTILINEKFEQLYTQVSSDYNMTAVCKEKKTPPMIFWIRKDITKVSKSKERQLLNDLQKHLSIDRIERELDNCCGTQEQCGYISRTVYKFIPELRKKGIFNDVYALFNSLTDKALLRGWKDAQAHEVIIDSVRDKLYHIPEGNTTASSE